MSPEGPDRAAVLDGLLPDLAEAADRLEADPAAWRALWTDRRLRAIAYVGVPERFNPHPFAEAGLGPRCDPALHLALVERLSRGSASALMALPASALSTRAVLRLGSEAQIERFFTPFAAGPAFAFFAVTEPDVGSDATAAATVLTADADGAGWRLSGTKTLIGSAGLADRGLALAASPGGGALRFVMLTRADGAGCATRALPSTGLCGAGLTRLSFDRVPVRTEDILAPNARRPALLTLGEVFEKHRPLVGAMALGTAYAMLDGLARAGVPEHRICGLRLAHSALLGRMNALGEAAAHGPLSAAGVSRFKAQAVALVDRVRADAAHLAPEALLQEPRLRRLWRDAGAFEYMEGTSMIHWQNAYREYPGGAVGRDRAA